MDTEVTIVLFNCFDTSCQRCTLIHLVNPFYSTSDSKTLSSGENRWSLLLTISLICTFCTNTNKKTRKTLFAAISSSEWTPTTKVSPRREHCRRKLACLNMVTFALDVTKFWILPIMHHVKAAVCPDAYLLIRHSFSLKFLQNFSHEQTVP